MDVKDKVVILTGGGRSLADRFSLDGANIVIAAASPALFTRLEMELGSRALVVLTDMRDRDSVQRLIQAAVDQFGRVDVLVNNVGQALVGRVDTVDPDRFHQAVELNVFGPLYALQAVVPEMRKVGGGVIVNVCATTLNSVPRNYSAYAVGKAALSVLSRTAREELKDENIRVLTVISGAAAALTDNPDDDEAARQSVVDLLRRFNQTQPNRMDRVIVDAVRTETAEITIN